MKRSQLGKTPGTCHGGKVEPELIAAEFAGEFRKGIPGLGASTLKALRDLSDGHHWALSGRKGDRAAGNGAAMRIAPLSFFLDVYSPADRRSARDICRITHHSEEAYVGALAILRAIQVGQNIADIATDLPDSNVRDTLLELSKLPKDTPPTEAAKICGTSGYVASSVPLAIFIALNKASITSAILSAVACGGDTDTIASMTGQILGARGAKTPDRWLSRIPREQIDAALQPPN